ncbi:MAG TPA: DNA replication/repair protein RecF [Thermomicrobiales bacterium]|nr:DNA replication/repair protein RecF [Thermomicrobiales bacterium]
MHLETISIAQFRCHAGVRITVPDAGVRIVGPNGSGKTSILEAIGMLAITRSFRGANDRDVVSWGSGKDFGVAPFSRIEATVETDGEHRRLGIALELADGGETVQSKRFFVDDKLTTAHGLVGNLRTVTFTPEDVQLVIGPPADRRRPLDVLISQLDRRYMRRLAAYGRVLRQRNGLLKAFARDRVRPEATAAVMQLAFWDEQLVAEGGYLIARRAQVVDKLDAAIRRRASSMSNGNDFSLQYDPRVRMQAESLTGDLSLDDAAVRANEAFRRDLEAHREDEFRRGMTLTGPHRDDVLYLNRGRSLARFGSRGQQRLAVLALKLAEADVISMESGDTPVFLLDDILSELDPRHRSMLLDELANRQAQTILTSADDEVLDHPALEALGRFQTVVPTER